MGEELTRVEQRSDDRCPCDDLAPPPLMLVHWFSGGGPLVGRTMVGGLLANGPAANWRSGSGPWGSRARVRTDERVHAARDPQDVGLAEPPRG